MHSKKADRVILGSVALAAVAMLLLGWQVVRSLQLIDSSGSIENDAGIGAGFFFIAGVTACVVVALLLWAVVHNSRACNRAETRLHWMTHQLPGAFYTYRQTASGLGSYEFLTMDAGNVLGIDRDELVQDATSAYRWVLPEDRERLQDAFMLSRTDLSAVREDFRIRKADGELHVIRTLAVPVRSSSGDVVWNGHLFDITEIMRTEQALREASQRLEDAQSVASLGDWTCHLATGEVTWSSQMYALLGRDRSLGPPSLAEVIDLPLEGPEPMANAFELAQTTGEAQAFEATTRRHGDQVLTFDVIVLPVCDDTGNVIGMRGTMQDITVRKALEDRLLSSKEESDATNRAKSAFLATMSHEIRTPLNGMLGLLELISLTPVNPEIQTALDAVRESGQSLQRIIDDILDFSKVEAGKLQIFPEPTRLLDLVDSVHRVFAGSAKSLGLDFTLHVDPEISPVLMLDALRLRQILSNFVSNAMKFTSKGGVELRVVSEGRDANLECLRFEVVDSGIGIAPEEQHMLFQEFEQAQSIANRYGGTGLGLSISRRLAELMGGNVNMASKLGTGTTMTLHIVAFVANPLLVPERSENQIGVFHDRPVKISPHAAASHPAQAEAFDAGPLILVVDDHPINRMVMRKQANTLGYAVEDVESGALALEQWRTGKFALVLTDLNMPGMSGYDLTRQIRQAEASTPGLRIPIIACSANAIAGVREDCADAGMDDYIAKPIKLTELSEKLNQWLPSSNQPPQQSPTPLDAPMDAATQRLPGVLDDDRAAVKESSLSGISRQALAHFKQVNDVDVQQLLEAVERADTATVTHMAHRIKGACGFIGATGLASVCGMIEQAGRDQDSAGVAWLMDVFHIELEQLNATLDA